jgi:hypothetical protein
MTDPRRDAGTGQDGAPGTPPRMPRWVKVAGIVVGVLLVVFIVLQLAGVGGQHGPGRHTLGGSASPARVVGHASPAAGAVA